MLAGSSMGPGRAWRPATTLGQEHILEGPRMKHCTDLGAADLWLIERDGWMMRWNFHSRIATFRRKHQVFLLLSPCDGVGFSKFCNWILRNQKKSCSFVLFKKKSQQQGASILTCPLSYNPTGHDPLANDKMKARFLEIDPVLGMMLLVGPQVCSPLSQDAWARVEWGQLLGTFPWSRQRVHTLVPSTSLALLPSPPYSKLASSHTDPHASSDVQVSRTVIDNLFPHLSSSNITNPPGQAQRSLSL